MPSPSSPSQVSALVSELATLPNTFDTLHSSTRHSSLISLRQSIRVTSPPAFTRALVLRTVSRLLGPSSPPENTSWTGLPLWDEAILETLFALLVDALDESGYDAQQKKLSTLPVTERHRSEELSEFGKLMLTPQEQHALAERASQSESDDEEPFPVAASLFPSAPEVPFALQAAISGSEPAQLAAAHVSHALATTARYDRAPAVRRAALLALAALARAMPPELLAAFLPGLASGLARVLQNTTLEQAPLVVAALDAFAAVVFGAFPADEKVNNESQSETLSFSAALEQRRSRSPAAATVSRSTAQNGIEDSASKSDSTARRVLLVIRNSSWSAAASVEVSLRLRLFLESRSGPSSHSSVRARLAVCRFARVALSDMSTLELDAHALCLLRLTLVEMAGDGYPVVRIEALRAVKRLVQRGRLKLRQIERDLKALIKVVNSRSDILDIGTGVGEDEAAGNGEGSGVERKEESKGVESIVTEKLIEVKDDEFWVRLSDGYLRVLLPSKEEGESESLSILNTSDQLAGSLVRIGVDPFCKMLMSMHEALWRPSADSKGVPLAELDNRVLATSFEMGRAGLLASIYSTLFSYGSWNADDETDDSNAARTGDSLGLLSSFKSRAHAILILQAAVRGAIGADDLPQDNVNAHIRHISQSAKDVLGVLATFLLPTMHDNASGAGLVDDIMISLKRCLLHCTSELIKDLSIACERLCSRPVASDTMLIVLMSLLKDVSRGEKSIRKTGLITLRSIAKTTRCTDERGLLARHLNYIVSRLTKHLEERWAGDVLSFIIGSEGDDVSEEATILLEGTLRDLNNSLAGAGDARALKSLAAIESVLVTAVRQGKDRGPRGEDDAQEGNRINDDPHVISAASSATLHKKLFFYSTEDIDDYSELTMANEIEAECTEEDAEEEENGVRSAFEALALNTLDGMRDLLVGRPWNVRASALSCATLAVYLLKDNRKDLLPHAANILPLLPDQFVVLQQKRSAGDRLLDRMKQRKIRGREDAEDIEDLVNYLNGKGSELPVVTNACLLLSALAQCAGSFIQNRFVQLIYPKMRPLLRLASCFPTLVASSAVKNNRNATLSPSYGAMSASDACLQAIASIASMLPEALAPHSFSIVKHLAVFYSPEHDPRSRVQRNVGHLNRSMLRYESERWQKRARWAGSIMRSLKTVNPGEVLTALLCNDDSAPAVVESRYPSLHSVRIGKSQSILR